MHREALKGRAGGEGNCGNNFHWFLWGKEQVRQESRKASLGLVSLNNFSALWSIGTVPVCLVLDPGVIGQVDSDPESVGSDKRHCWGCTFWIG